MRTCELCGERAHEGPCYAELREERIGEGNEKGRGMSESAVVKVLAEKQGLPRIYPCDAGTSGFCYHAGDSRGRAVPNYCVSRDAIAGVLGKLTEEEWGVLYWKLEDAHEPKNDSSEPNHWKWILTLPTEQLARAVAEAIVVCRKQFTPRSNEMLTPEDLDRRVKEKLGDAQPASPPYCHGASDGECIWDQCPQRRDGEPARSGRHCPLDDGREYEPSSEPHPANAATGEKYWHETKRCPTCHECTLITRFSSFLCTKCKRMWDLNSITSWNKGYDAAKQPCPRCAELEAGLGAVNRALKAHLDDADALLEQRDDLKARIEALEKVLRGLIYSSDAEWYEKRMGHDWKEAVDDANAVLAGGKEAK